MSHSQLPTFGSGSDLNKKQWEAVFLQIMGLDLIRPSSERRGAFYLTKKSLPVLRGLEKINLSLIDLHEDLEVNKREKPRSLVLEKDEPLFLELRQKRRQLAISMNVPSYIIFSDKTLVEMVYKKPKTLDEMHLITGIGQKKLIKFGDKFLRIINGKDIKKTHPTRKKLVGKSNAWLYDLIEEVISKHSRGTNGLDKPVYVSPSLILKILQREPRTLSDLKNINGMTSGILQRYGEPLIRAISSSG